MTKISSFAVVAVVASASLMQSALAFTPAQPSAFSRQVVTRMADDSKEDSVFLAPEEGEVDADASFSAVENMGRGGAKVRPVSW